MADFEKLWNFNYGSSDVEKRNKMSEGRHEVEFQTQSPLIGVLRETLTFLNLSLFIKFG